MKVRSILMGFTLLASVCSTGCNRNKQEAIILANKGDVMVDANPGDAIQKYEEAVKLDENHAILFKLAKAYRKKEDWEKVQSTLQRAVARSPSFANYWFELGFAIEMQAKKPEKGGAKWSDAVDPYTKCVEADSNDDRCHAHLADALYHGDDEQKALQKLSDAIEKRPADGDMTKKCVEDPAIECAVNHYTSLAHRYILLDYVKEAEQVLNAAVEMADPKDKRLYNVYTLLAEVYGEQRDTDKMVNAEFIAAMKDESLFVNIARGRLVDEDALLAGLDRGKPSMAILDVFEKEPLPTDSPFWDHPRVMLSAHCAADSPMNIARGDEVFLGNLTRYLKGETLRLVVDDING